MLYECFQSTCTPYKIQVFEYPMMPDVSLGQGRFQNVVLRYASLLVSP